jgi:hypothetical protein
LRLAGDEIGPAGRACARGADRRSLRGGGELRMEAELLSTSRALASLSITSLDFDTTSSRSRVEPEGGLRRLGST